MTLLFTLPLILIKLASSATKYAAMSCSETGYINGWDGGMNYNKEFFAGFYSYHSNNREDRRYKYKHCHPSANDVSTNSLKTLDTTWYDYSWMRGCGGNTLIKGLESWHSNNKEDRQWKVKCAGLNNYILRDCVWTSNWVNEWDSSMNYQCEYNGVVRTIESYHSNNKEDRRFKFECCRMVKSDLQYPSFTTKDYPSYYANDYDGTLNYLTTNYYFINGIYSVHNNNKEDRRFKFSQIRITNKAAYNQYEIISNPNNPSEVYETSYDNTWTISCSLINNGNSGIIGLYSTHSNNREDRVWKNIKCGKLVDEYSVTNCGYTGYINNWDSTMNYKCQNNGIIRSIWSKHDNGREDRLYRIECCNIINGVEYSFANKNGYWKELQNCNGCQKVEYVKTIGIENTETTSTTTQFETSFTLSITQGFTFGEEVTGQSSFEITASSTLAFLTSNTIESSVTQIHTETTVTTCAQNGLYQWIQTATESTAGEQIIVASNQFVCADQAPKCVPGDCKDGTQCQICASNNQAGYN